MADKDWRPQLVKILSEEEYRSIGGRPGCAECAEYLISAMHKADVEYLDGKCTEHPCGDLISVDMNGPHVTGHKYPEHRKDCPICYAAWKGKQEK